MKKILSSIFVTLLGLVSYSASAATFTIDVDHADYVEVGYTEMQFGIVPVPHAYTLQDGADNTITTDKETSFFVRVPSGSLAVIESVTKDNVAVSDYENISIEDGMHIVIRTHMEDGAATCTVNCDDYTQVYMTINGNQVELTSNSQQVDFTRGEMFELKHVDENKKLADVKLNGVSQTPDYNSYTLHNVANSDVIDIRAIPVEYDVTFTFNDDRARQYITGVEADSTAQADYASGFKATEGAYVSMKVDESIAGMEVKVNGNVYSVNPFFHDISFYVEQDTEVVVTHTDVPEPEKIVAHVTVDNASNVSLFYVEAGFLPWLDKEIPFELNDRDNEVEIPEGVATIYAKPATNCKLTSVKLNDEDVAIDETTGRYAFDVAKDMSISITSQVLEATASFTFVCAEPSKVKLTLGDTPYELTGETEQTINFIPETQSNITIEPADAETPIKEVLHNGNAVDGASYYYIENLQDNDRVEVTLPNMYNVTITYGEGADTNYINNVVLVDTPVEDYSEGFKVPEGKSVSIYVNSDIKNHRILVDGEPQTPDPMFSYVYFEVNKDTEVKVENTAYASVETLEAEANKTVYVYGVDGILIKEGHKAEVMSELPAGCYIIDGKKVMIGK